MPGSGQEARWLVQVIEQLNRRIRQGICISRWPAGEAPRKEVRRDVIVKQQARADVQLEEYVEKTVREVRIADVLRDEAKRRRPNKGKRDARPGQGKGQDFGGDRPGRRCSQANNRRAVEADAETSVNLTRGEPRQCRLTPSRHRSRK